MSVSEPIISYMHFINQTLFSDLSQLLVAQIFHFLPEVQNCFPDRLK